MFNTPCNVLIQEKVEDEYLGRGFRCRVHGVKLGDANRHDTFRSFGGCCSAVEYMLAVTGVILFIQSLYDKKQNNEACRIAASGKGESLK